MARDTIAHSVAGGVTFIAALTLVPVNPEAGLIGMYMRSLGGSYTIGGPSMGINGGYLFSNTAAHTYINMAISGTFFMTANATGALVYLKLYSEGTTGAQG